MFEGQGWKKKGHHLYAVGHRHAENHDTHITRRSPRGHFIMFSLLEGHVIMLYIP